MIDLYFFFVVFDHSVGCTLELVGAFWVFTPKGFSPIGFAVPLTYQGQFSFPIINKPLWVSCLMAPLHALVFL